MQFLVLILMTVVFILAIVVFWQRIFLPPDEGAHAARPEEVLAALQWETHGTYAAGRFEGRHKDRNVEIAIQSGHYRISLEGVPELGDLTGEEAIARIRAARPVTPEWDVIVRVFHANPFRFEKGRLVARADFGGGVLGVHEEAVRLRRLLDRLVEVTKVAQVALSMRAREGQETRCPYCHDDLGDSLPVTQCPRCGARHHVACFAEHGKCAVFACSAVAPQGLRDLAGPGKAPGGTIRSV